jgi:hypothetical protein
VQRIESDLSSLVFPVATPSMVMHWREETEKPRWRGEIEFFFFTLPYFSSPMLCLSASIYYTLKQILLRLSFITWNPSNLLYHATNKVKEKVYFSSPNSHQSPFFLSQLQNRTNHLPQLFKPCISPPSSGFEAGSATVNGGMLQWTVVCCSTVVLSFFYLFRLNLWKIIVNHRKIIK